MSLFTRIRSKQFHGHKTRGLRLEALEARRLLAADPIRGVLPVEPSAVEDTAQPRGGDELFAQHLGHDVALPIATDQLTRMAANDGAPLASSDGGGIVDLNAYSFDADITGDDIVNAGDTISVFIDYENIGSLAVLGTAYDIGFYLSADPTFDPMADLFVTYVDGVDLEPLGGFHQQTVSITLPSTLSSAWSHGAGTYYLGMYVDDLFGVPEITELNNWLSDDLNVSLPGANLADLNAYSYNADTTGDDIVNAGDTISVFIDYENIGSLAVLGTAYDIGFYLSADPTFDPMADLLVTYVDGVDLEPLGDFHQQTVSITLPSTLSSAWSHGAGTYYLGMYVDDLFDVPEITELNNWLSDDLNVSLPGANLADLNAFSFNADVGGDDNVTVGDTISVFIDYDNLGTLPVLGTDYDIGFYLSTDATIDPSTDWFVGFINGVDLGPSGDFHQQAVSVTLRANPFFLSGSGTYYLGMYVDDLFEVPEITELNNWLSDDLNITVPQLPDLRTFSFNADVTGDDNVLAGETLDVYVDYDNIGMVPVLGTGYDIGFYLSTDATIDPSDWLVEFNSGVDLNPFGAFHAQTISIALPGPSSGAWSMGSGTYYLGMYVDDLFEIGELNELNNWLSDNLNVTVTLPDLGDFNMDGVYDCTDVDDLVAEIAGMTHNAAYDLNSDSLVNQDDLAVWLAVAGAAPGSPTGGDPFLYGDANLDGSVNGQDFIAWNINKFTSGMGWCGADFNADGVTNGGDFVIWNVNKFTSSDAGSISDPIDLPNPRPIDEQPSAVALPINRRETQPTTTATVTVKASTGNRHEYTEELVDAVLAHGLETPWAASSQPFAFVGIRP